MPFLYGLLCDVLFATSLFTSKGSDKGTTCPKILLSKELDHMVVVKLLTIQAKSAPNRILRYQTGLGARALPEGAKLSTANHCLI
jgi:hypothetical protein